MSFISVSKIESIAAEAYTEFYANNKELFKNNIQEYWFLASRFKDEKVRYALYAEKNRSVKDYDPTEDIYVESTKLLDSLNHKHNSKHKFLSLF